MKNNTFENPFDLDTYCTVALDLINSSIDADNAAIANGENLDLTDFIVKARENWIAVDLKSNESYMETLWNEVLNTRAVGEEQPFDGAGYAAKLLHRAAGLKSAEDVMIDLAHEESSDFDHIGLDKLLETMVLMDMAAHAPRVFCMVYGGFGDFDYSVFADTFARFRKELRRLAVRYLTRMDYAQFGNDPEECVAVNYKASPAARWQFELHFHIHETTESFYLEKLVDLADLNYARITQGAQPL